MRLDLGLFVIAALALADAGPAPPSPAATSRRPNIVVVLTDDQDLRMDSLDYMPLLHKHLAAKGTSYQRHYCSTAVCCPSRVTLWTGKYSHNSNVTDVVPPYGGYPKFVSEGLNDNYLPVWLQQHGYNTFYTGKLFNAHTVENYNNPYPAGWTSTAFLLDPFTYEYLNATFQRNQDPPVSYEGDYSTDVLAQQGFSLLAEAVDLGDPFFLTFAPIASHSNVAWNQHENADRPPDQRGEVVMTAPVAAARHEHLFAGARVPRTANFNPDTPNSVAWLKGLDRLTDDMVAYTDLFYRKRLQTLQAVDELIEGLVERLDAYGVLDNTYIIYTTDNGYHLGQHRLPPGKTCGFEEDINIPLIIRGPGVPAGDVSHVVTAHTDFAPTVLALAGAPLRDDFDGSPIPLTAAALAAETQTRQEHVNVEFWGHALPEGTGGFSWDEGRYVTFGANNTYKTLRVIGAAYDVAYTVWCNNEHELYDMQADPGQVHNVHPSVSATTTTVAGVAVGRLLARLDALLMITKSCRGAKCVRPWAPLHPDGTVRSLAAALAPRFDAFYRVVSDRAVRFDRCAAGYILDAEGPQADAAWLRDVLAVQPRVDL